MRQLPGVLHYGCWFVPKLGIFERYPAWETIVGVCVYALDVHGFELRVREVKEMFKLLGLEPNELEGPHPCSPWYGVESLAGQARMR